MDDVTVYVKAMDAVHRYELIDDDTARIIASWWQSPGRDGAGLAGFASTGLVSRATVDDGLRQLESHGRAPQRDAEWYSNGVALMALADYFERAPTGTVACSCTENDGCGIEFEGLIGGDLCVSCRSGDCDPTVTGHCTDPLLLCGGLACADHEPGRDWYGDVTVVVDGVEAETRVVPSVAALDRYCNEHDADVVGDAVVEMYVVWHGHGLDGRDCACARQEASGQPYRTWNKVG